MLAASYGDTNSQSMTTPLRLEMSSERAPEIPALSYIHLSEDIRWVVISITHGLCHFIECILICLDNRLMKTRKLFAEVFIYS